MAANNQDYLESFGNIPALEAEKTAIVNMLKEMFIEYQKVSKLTINLGASSNTKQLITDSKTLETVFNKLKKSADDLTVTINSLGTSQQKLSQAIAANAAAIGALNPQLQQTNTILNQGTTATTSFGNSMKKAANDSGGFFSGLRSGFGIIRQLAYILPGLGIAGIFNIIFQSIGNAVEAMGIFTKLLSVHQREVKYTTEAYEGAREGFVKAKTEVYNLKVAFDQAREGIITKDEALKLYNTTMGRTTGQVKTLDEAETAYAKNAEAYVKFMLYKAAAQYALQKAAENAFKAQVEQNKKNEEFAKGTDKLATTLTFGSFGGYGAGGPTKAEQKRLEQDIFNERENRRQIQIDEAKKDQAVNEKIADDFFKQAENLSGEFQFDWNAIVKPKDSKDKVVRTKAIKEEGDDIIKAYEAQHQAILQAREIQLRAELKLQDDIVNNKDKKAKTSFDPQGRSVAQDKVNFEDRLAALEAYHRIKQQLIDNDFKEELSKIKGQEEAKIKNTKNPALKTALEKEYLARKGQAEVAQETQTAALVKEIEEKKFELIKTNQEKVADLYKKSYSNLKDSIEKTSGIESLKRHEEQLNEIKLLDDKYRAGTFRSIEDYEIARRQLQTKHENEEVNAEIEKLKKLAALAFVYGQDYVSIEEKITALKLAQYKKDTKNFESEAKKKEKIENELANKRKELANAGADFLKSLVEGQYDKESQSIKNLIEQVDRRMNAELAANETLVQSADKKAQNEAIIRQRAEVQKQVLERRQKEADYKKAQFDRLVAIAQVAANTAIAVSKDLIGAKYLIPFDIAIGALQIAAILSKPLPRFKGGLDHDYEGFAVVGDGGTPEVHSHKDGRISITPDRDTVTKVEKGDRIYSSVDEFISKALRISSGGDIIKKVFEKAQFEDKNIVKALGEVKSAIREKGRNGQDFRTLAAFQNYMEYKDRQTNF